MPTAIEIFKANVAAKKNIKGNGRIITANDTMLRLWQDFRFEMEGQHKSEQSLKTYEKHFHKICEWIGWMSRNLGSDEDYENTRLECRELGEAQPIAILDEPSIGTYYYDYLVNVCPHLSEQTMISCMRNFRVFHYWAQEHKLLAAQKISVKTVEAPIKATFTTDEIYKLTRKKPNVENFCDLRNWVIIQFLLATGCRIGSLLNVLVRDVNFEDNEISLQITKTRHPQIIALVPKLKAVLGEWIKVYRMDSNSVPLFDEPLFCNQYGSQLTYDTISDSMNDYFDRRYVKWEGFHKFRHHYAATWIRKGGDSLQLKAQLGHKTLVMTNRYANLYGGAVKKEAEKYGAINAVKIETGRKKIKPNT